jgi:hypothetical protein
MFNTSYAGEIDRAYDFVVVDLIDAFADRWTAAGPYPGAPYDHNEFRKYFSDHHPVVFRMTIPQTDDDTPAIASAAGIQ